MFVLCSRARPVFTISLLVLISSANSSWSISMSLFFSLFFLLFFFVFLSFLFSIFFFFSFFSVIYFVDINGRFFRIGISNMCWWRDCKEAGRLTLPSTSHFNLLLLIYYYYYCGNTIMSCNEHFPLVRYYRVCTLQLKYWPCGTSALFINNYELWSYHFIVYFHLHEWD